MSAEQLPEYVYVDTANGEEVWHRDEVNEYLERCKRNETAAIIRINPDAVPHTTHTE